MKKTRGSDLRLWSEDVAKIAGVEVMFLKEDDGAKGFSSSLTEKLLLLTLVMSLTLVCSATYYFVYSVPGLQAPAAYGAMEMKDAVSGPINSEETSTSMETTTTTTSTSTTTSTTTSTSTTTTTTSTTTTTIECGADWQPPCDMNGTLKCDPGMELGAENICHDPMCAPTVASGNVDGNCGKFALEYCQN